MTELLRVGVVVVAYQAAAEQLKKLLTEIIPQATAVCVVINQEDSALDLPALQANYAQVDWIINDKNQGLAVAQNQGINRLLEGRVEAILLLDQDTLPGANGINQLAAVLQAEQAKQAQPIGAIGPAYVQDGQAHWPGFVQIQRFGFGRIHPANNQPSVSVDFLIASGMLMPVEALQAVGLMDERLFIDHVDTEWCLRAKAKGWLLLGTEKVFFLHQLGERRHWIWLGRWRQVSTHAPWRYYMMVRNSVLLTKMDHLPAHWKRINALRVFWLGLFVLVMGPERRRSLAMFWFGLRDGLAGGASAPPAKRIR